ncbi:MAG: phosphoribosylaminoimidazolesuccinocarboxamide synthase [Syntrophobacteraceae bacterium CG2_30_61_12]|nr:MAG: phosphoribosylaminoimidazolesuccinocarboxamide synthase [Syntrophobacteraceae bacterium CG2_30_61_12]
MATATVNETALGGLHLVSRGKVRDIYDLGDSLIIVVTDRISAFDVVMRTPIPDKGRILNQVAAFWFEFCRDVIENHLITTDVEAFPASCLPHREVLRGRGMWVRKARPLPVECIVRGYLAGSGWNDYENTGKVCGLTLPAGLRQAEQLPRPLFTPSTKAAAGTHDENIPFERMQDLVGAELAARVRDLSIEIYRRAADYARERGIIVADTKFEFGLLDGRLILIDEVLTPDSSRFWPADRYRVGTSPESFDKQYLRDYLLGSGWTKNDPAPELPPEVVANTRARYLEALRRLTGTDLVA